ncbi:rCG29557, isoform CRA_a [Rattus norvegicus]|uniref:RCG29557, isoform CRA_a n=1 Tax=Rattus norvegicus TaxID=10116 RepID=A6IML9_RAT|nr:rCG29557, isoform CRA_a [Rattus norvegicus]EDM01571.1 rCG29557, isoform CRA_a [Rattus norvegicus]
MGTILQEKNKGIMISSSLVYKKVKNRTWKSSGRLEMSLRVTPLKQIALILNNTAQQKRRPLRAVAVQNGLPNVCYISQLHVCRTDLF